MSTMVIKMETYYYQLVSKTGRFLTLQMVWRSVMAGQIKVFTNAE